MKSHIYNSLVLWLILGSVSSDPPPTQLVMLLQALSYQLHKGQWLLFCHLPSTCFHQSFLSEKVSILILDIKYSQLIQHLAFNCYL